MKFNVTFLLIGLVSYATSIFSMEGETPTGDSVALDGSGFQDLYRQHLDQEEEQEVVDNSDNSRAEENEQGEEERVGTNTGRGPAETGSQLNSSNDPKTDPVPAKYSFFTKKRILLLSCLSGFSLYMIYNYFMNKTQPSDDVEIIIDSE